MTDVITVNEHSSIRIQDGSKVIYVDPFHIKGKPNDADYVMITHDHFDHFSPEDIEKISKPSTILVIPGTMMGKAREVAGLINVMKPQVAIPIHYGSVAGSKGDAKVFKKFVDSSIQVEIKL